MATSKSAPKATTEEEAPAPAPPAVEKPANNGQEVTDGGSVTRGPVTAE